MSGWENFATGLLQGYTVSLQNDLDRRNRERTTRLKANLEAQQEQMDRNNLSNTLMGFSHQEAPELDGIDTTDEPPVVTSRSIVDDIARNVEQRTADLVRAGASADDAFQYAREEYGNQMDRMDARKGALMAQSYAAIANGDLPGAMKLFLHGTNFMVDGITYAPKQTEGGELVLDMFDEDSGEMLGSMPFTAGTPELFMMQASAVPAYFANRKKEAEDAARSNQRLALDQGRFARQEEQDVRRTFGQTRELLVDALKPIGVSVEDHVFNMAPEEQRRFEQFAGIAQELASAAAEMGQTTTNIAAMEELLRDANSLHLLNNKQSMLKIEAPNVDGGGWIEYKGKRFYAPQRARDLFRALKQRMPA